MIKLTNHSLSIKYSIISFFIWSYFPLKGAIIFLFFKDDPAIGTFFSNFIIMLIVLILMPSSYIPDMVHGGIFEPNGNIGNASVTIQIIWIFLTWSGLSLLWTMAHSIIISAFYLISICLEVVIVCLLFKRNLSIKVVKSSLYGFMFGSLLYANIALFLAGFKAGGRLGDESFLHPNSIGYTLSLAVLTGSFLVTCERSWFVIISLCSCSIVLLLCMSKTSILCTFISLLFSYVIFGGANISKKVKYTVSFSLVFITCYLFLHKNFMEYLLQDSGNVAITLTGRTYIWENTWAQIKNNVIVGHGFFSFRDFGPQLSTNRISTAHNEVLNILFSLGVIGIAIVISIYISFYITIRRQKQKDLYFFRYALSMFIFSILRGITEASATGIIFPLYFISLFTIWAKYQDIVYENSVVA